jgi:hypothetical protein
MTNPLPAPVNDGRWLGSPFPESWGEPPDRPYSATRAAWVAANVDIELRQKARNRLGRHRPTPEECRRVLELERHAPWGPVG